MQQLFSDNEWLALLQAPSQAIMAILLVDKADPISFLKEVKAAVKVLIEEAQQGNASSALVRSLIDSMRTADTAQATQPDELQMRKEYNLLGQLQTMESAADGRKVAINLCKQVGSILTGKVSAAEASEYKKWVLSLARKVAESVKEEGFMGIGGERISNAELSVLEDLEKALDVKV
jgi:hypothetical protein